MDAATPLYITGACRSTKRAAEWPAHIAQWGKMHAAACHAHMFVTAAKDSAGVQRMAGHDASMLLIISVEMICDDRAFAVKVNTKICCKLPQLI